MNEHPFNVLQDQVDKDMGVKTPGNALPSTADVPEKKPEFQQKAIRTFESDLADAMAKGHSTIATMVTAENKRKIEQQKEAERIAKLQTKNEQRTNPQVEHSQAPSNMKMGNLIGGTSGFENSEQDKINNKVQTPLPDLTPQKAEATPSGLRGFNLSFGGPKLQKLDTYIPEQQEKSNEKPPEPKVTVMQTSIPENKPEPKSKVEIPVLKIPDMPAPVVRPVIQPNIKPIAQAIVRPPIPIQETNDEVFVENKHTFKKIALVSLSIILIGSGIAGGYYLYLKSPIAPDEAVEPTIKIASLITTDIQKKLVMPSLEKAQVIQTISEAFAKQDVENGKMIELIPVQNVGSTTIRFTASQFIDSTELSMTESLKRAITDKWMLGVYTSDDSQNTPFIILSTDFFQNAYAGMLKWEAQMPEELKSVLNYSDKIAQNYNNNETLIGSFYNVRGKFVDKTIRNRDIREFVLSNGETLMLYSFIDKDTVIITTSESVIPAIIDRIEKQTYVR